MKPEKLWYIFVGFVLLMPLFSCGSNTPYKANSQFSQYSGDDESGIGGTGILANKSGIGGTGIIGEITGFGSIFVNGVEVEVTLQTKLFVDGDEVEQHKFARGEVVALRFEKTGKLNVAHEIFIRHEVIGKVEKVLPQTKQFVILGQLVDGHALTSLPVKGSFIQVSGFRDNKGTIHARHTGVSQGKQNMIRGELKKHNNKWFVGQQQLNISGRGHFKAGEVVRIQGVVDKRVLQVIKIQRSNRLPFSKTVRTILMQGQVQKSGGQLYTISGYRFTVSGVTKQLLQKADSIVLLQRTSNIKGWKLMRILNRAKLPMGTPLPARHIFHQRPVPVRPMSPKMPNSVPYRFFN